MINLIKVQLIKTQVTSILLKQLHYKSGHGSAGVNLNLQILITQGCFTPTKKEEKIFALNQVQKYLRMKAVCKVYR